MQESNPPKTLYHAAPKSAREDISVNGLDPKENTWNTGADSEGKYENEHLWTKGEDGELFAYEYRPAGIYMFEDKSDGERYASGFDMDLYSIDTDTNNREIIRDPSSAVNWDYLDDGKAYVTRYVEPSALTIVSSVEKHLGMGVVPFFVKFAPDLVPTLKHLGSKHDQKTHGRWSASGKVSLGENITVEQTGKSTYNYSYFGNEFTTDLDYFEVRLKPDQGLDPSDALDNYLRDLAGLPPDSEASQRAFRALQQDISETKEYTGYELDQLGEIAQMEQWNQWEGNYNMRTISGEMMGLDRPAGGSDYFTESELTQIENRTGGWDEVYVPTTHAMMSNAANSVPTDFSMERAMVVRDNSRVLETQTGDSIAMPLSGFSPQAEIVDRFKMGGVFQADYSEDVYTPKLKEVVFNVEPGAKGVRMSPDYDLSYDSLMPQELPMEVTVQGRFEVTGRNSTFKTNPDTGEDYESVEFKIKQTQVFNPATGDYDDV